MVCDEHLGNPRLPNDIRAAVSRSVGHEGGLSRPVSSYLTGPRSSAHGYRVDRAWGPTPSPC